MSLSSRRAGVKGAIIGQTIGTTMATLICVALIGRSFEVGFSFGEVELIVQRGDRASRSPCRC